ncbi:hypothetical protein GTY65_25130 [Streptomyces sp. SID8379]|uniref:hypothetical protein n=1 Tax=unclassified Streptomyces TaxID=2593676 RepID=UPI000476531F|nr:MULTISPECIES: hypothetical protein [unclassified Streptomyces]MYW67324.1 hypothetical protein [Streptomyces sp. SID8379]
MTGSTPPWKRRTWTKRRDAAQGPSKAVRDDERGSFPGVSGTPGDSGEDASLESANGHEVTGDLAAAATAGVVDAVELRDADAAVGTETKAQLTRRRVTAVRDGVRKSGSAARTGMAKGGAAAKAGIGYLADQIIRNAPRVPVRDLAALRKQFPGLGPEQLADKLVAGAANATSTVGAGVGAAAMLPVPPAMPTELAAEITGVAAIELKLIAELHEVYGARPPGNLKDRSTAYLHSWSDERGIDVSRPTTINVALGGQMKRELRQQIMKRMVRNLPSLTPFMIGAAVGALMNRRDTKRLAERIRKDLRATQVPWDALGDLPPLEAPRDALEIEG